MLKMSNNAYYIKRVDVCKLSIHLQTPDAHVHSTGLPEVMRESNVEGMRLHFIKFETKYIESCLEFIQQKLDQSGQSSSSKVVKCTGGGAYKYFDLVSSKLRLEYVHLT